MQFRGLTVLLMLSLLALSACDQAQEVVTEAEVPTPPVAKWDTRPQGEAWTEATLGAIAAHGQSLVRVVPRDIGQWCPAYPAGDDAQRAAFWNGLASALAEHESTWNPTAVGGGGRWFGLVQISPATARGYGCKAKSGEALKSGPGNLSCAIRIWAKTVPRDGVVSSGGGVAADWGPFHQSRKREAMRRWISTQDYCTL